MPATPRSPPPAPDQIKVEDKFRQNPELARQLPATGAAQLAEENAWGDTFRGVCHCRGQNWMGKILMAVRDELAAAGG